MEILIGFMLKSEDYQLTNFFKPLLPKVRMLYCPRTNTDRSWQNEVMQVMTVPRTYIGEYKGARNSAMNDTWHHRVLYIVADCSGMTSVH